MAITVKDLSNLTGISTSTISRYLSRHGYVAGDTRHIIERAILESGYVYKPAINRRSSTGLVMLVMAESSNQIYGENIKGIISVFDTAGILCVGTYGDQSNAEKQEFYIKYAIRNHYKGLMILSPFETEKFTKMMRHCSIPVVALNRHIEANDIDEVCLDNINAGRMAVHYLYKKGHVKIAHMGVYDNTAGNYRLKGYLSAMKELGGEMKEDYVIKGSNTFESAMYSGEVLVKENSDITAIYAANETLAIGLIEGIRRAGKRVPEDISIVSTDDTRYSVMSNPQLTTLACNHYEVGVVAANLFLERLNNPLGEKKKILFEPRIIERASVRDLPK